MLPVTEGEFHAVRVTTLVLVLMELTWTVPVMPAPVTVSPTAMLVREGAVKVAW